MGEAPRSKLAALEVVRYNQVMRALPILLAVSSPFLWAMGRAPKEPPVAQESLRPDVQPSEWQGAFCSVDKPDVRVIDNALAWESLWRRAFNAAPPPADFDTHVAVAVFLGERPTGGYEVEFLEPEIGPAEVVIPYRVQEPEGMAIQAFTQPYAIHMFKKPGVPLRPEMRKADG